MLTFLKYFISPAIVPLVGIIYAIYIAYEWEHSPPKMIDGQLNDGPWCFAIVLFGFCTFAYFPLLLVNFICLKIYKSKRNGLFVSYLIAIVLGALLIGSRNLIHGDRLFSTLGAGLTVSTIFILPMAICSWAIANWQAKHSQNLEKQSP